MLRSFYSHSIGDTCWWRKVMTKWTIVSLLLLSACLLLRVYMSVRLSIELDFSLSRSLIVLSGIYMDLLWMCRIALLSLIPFLLISLWSPKAATFSYTALVVICTLLYVCLVEYFVNTKQPLDHVFLTYSPRELYDIILSSTSFSIWFFLGLFLFIAVSVLFFYVANKEFYCRWCALVFFLLALAAELCSHYKTVLYNELHYPTTTQYNLAVNQLSYTLHKIADHKRQSADYLTHQELMDAVVRMHGVYPDISFSSREYPFMHSMSDEDVLGPYFKQTSDTLPPNFVFIIVESLGKELSCVPTPVLSFTPFLDSLASQSLYWKNCLSTTERTFGVLPALFSSAPFGYKGFGNVWVPVPDHQSLFLDLKQNNYESAFYYGGCAAFNGQDRFLLNNGVGHIMEVDMEQLDKERSQELKDNNRWGIDDKEMFAMAIDERQMINLRRPYIEVYQTLTSHEPFIFEQRDEYMAKVAEMAKRAEKELAKQPVEYDMIKSYPQIFASFLYVDDCIRKLFDYYCQQPDFDNTVFVITGDHCVGGVADENPIRAYHVPLIIYSPLLYKPKEMAAVVSHADVTPSLIAYLKNNYCYRTNVECCWLGTSLDTNTQFRSLKRMAFMRNNRDVLDYLHHEYYLVGQRLYRLLQDMQVEPLQDSALQQRLIQERNDYIWVNRYVSNNDYLLSPNLSQRGRLCHYEWDFEHVIPAYYKNIIREDADGNHFAIADRENPYLPLMLPVKLEENYDKLFLDFSFDLKVSGRQNSDAVVVVDISDERGSAYYKHFEIYSETGQPVSPRKKTRCQLKTTLLLTEQDVKGKTIKVVLQRGVGTTIQLDNLKAQIEVLK